MSRRITRDLRILDVHREGDDLLVDLYGGSENACGSVRFTFDQLQTPARQRAVRRWADSNTPVALIVDDDTIQLVPDSTIPSPAEP